MHHYGCNAIYMGALLHCICTPIACGIKLERGNAQPANTYAYREFHAHGVLQNTTYYVLFYISESMGSVPTGHRVFATHVLPHTLHCTGETVMFGNPSPYVILLCIYKISNICWRNCVIHSYDKAMGRHTNCPVRCVPHAARANAHKWLP